MTSYGYDPFGMSSGDTIFFTFFGLIVVIIVGVIIFSVIHGVKEWNSNNESPVLTVDAKIVSKRQQVSQSSDSSTTYHYVTFQVESGDRMEFSIRGKEYGLLAEGDQGKLTFQGTRYKGFQRL